MSRRTLVILAVLLAVACVLPFVVSNYRTFQFTLALVYAIALLGLNMLTGYNGQISLGHGAFYAIGAYTTAMTIIWRRLIRGSPAPCRRSPRASPPARR